jgi:hypothetical protein
VNLNRMGENMIRVLIVGLSLALGGCANLAPMTAAAPSDIAAFLCARAESHCVKTTVQNGQIVLDPVDVHVSPPRDRLHWVVWYLASDGYQFVDGQGNRPITFKTSNTQMNPEDPINGCYTFANSIVPSGKAYVCLNRNSQMGVFPYTIKVTPTGSGNPITRDPAVFND